MEASASEPPAVEPPAVEPTSDVNPDVNAAPSEARANVSRVPES